MRIRHSTSAVRLALATLFVIGSAPALAGSLYSGPNPRPGPDLLYDPAPAIPPPLQNTGVWQALPILVSGSSAYRDGEFLYQDFLYDDHGARQQPDPADLRAVGDAFSKPNGTYTYPTNPLYANNAADLVELRVKPLTDSTAFRITLNTLLDPSLIAFSIAIGDSLVALPFPAGANALAPAELFLTVHPSGSGMVADLVHALGGAPVGGGASTVAVDTARRQIEVRIPHAAWDPGTATVRLAAGVGLWDGVAGSYLLPQSTADATHPGGAGSAAAPAAFFNVAFRFDEPMPNVTDPAGTVTGPAWWRDRDQGTELAVGDISGLYVDIDFAKLVGAVNDESDVPQTGPIDRILASRFETAQGADFTVVCVTSEATCNGPYQGILQPYAIYVPVQPEPSQGYGMTLLLHATATNYNQFLGSRNQSQLGERGSGSIVITPESRGPDGNYNSLAGADVFEVWADVARTYHLDPAWSAITGYSMGGNGTFRLAERFPDLFARAQSTVGNSDNNALVASLRNIPLLMWNMAVDELVPAALYLPTALQLDSLGYRYELDVFTPGEHLTLAVNDQYAPAAEFLGMATVDRDPAHVTFVVDPSLDYPAFDDVADHAYWVSGVQPPSGSAAVGTIDVLSHGFGNGDPTPSGTQTGSGTLTGGTIPTIAYTRQYQTWGPTPAIPVENRADVSLQNIGAAHIALARAALDPVATLTLPVTTDGDGVLFLDGVFPPGRFVFEDGLMLAGGTASATGAVVPVKAGTHTYVIAAAPACGATPAVGCRVPAVAHTALLQLRNTTPDDKDRLLWKWSKGSATTKAEFGNPLATTGYQLCVYDGVGTLRESASAPAGGFCDAQGTRPCWRESQTGFHYVDKQLTPSGLRKLVLRAGPDGTARLKVTGKGPLLQVPALPIASLPIRVQLVNSDGTCWEAIYSSTIRNSTDQLKAKAD